MIDAFSDKNASSFHSREKVMERRISAVILSLLLSPSVLVAQESTRSVIERAIEVHGGQERLARFQADRARIKGFLVVNNKSVPFTGETVVNLPARIKTIIRLNPDGKEHILLQILNGDQAWVSIDGQPQKVEAASLADMQEAMALARVVRLMPLIKDRSYELTLLPETRVADRLTSAIKASVKGRKEIRLYFDKETGFLVKTEHPIDGGSGKEVLQEEYYSDFRDLNGFKRPIKISVYRKGARVMEAEMTEIKYYEKLEESEFSRP